MTGWVLEAVLLLWPNLLLWPMIQVIGQWSCCGCAPRQTMQALAQVTLWVASVAIVVDATPLSTGSGVLNVVLLQMVALVATALATGVAAAVLCARQVGGARR